MKARCMFLTPCGVSGGIATPMHSCSQQMSANYEYFSEPNGFLPVVLVSIWLQQSIKGHCRTSLAFSQ